MTKTTMIEIPEMIAVRYIRNIAHAIESIEAGDTDVTWDLGNMAQDLQNRVTKAEIQREGPECGTPANKMRQQRLENKQRLMMTKMAEALGINPKLVPDGYDCFGDDLMGFRNDYNTLLSEATIEPDWLEEGSLEWKAFETSQDHTFVDGIAYLRNEVTRYLAKFGEENKSK